MNLLEHYFLEKILMREDEEGRGGGDKNLDVHSLFQGGASFKLDGCGQRGWGEGVKKCALFCGRHKWMNPKVRFTVDRSRKCFVFTNNLHIKKGHVVLNFIFNCKLHVSMSTI